MVVYGNAAFVAEFGDRCVGLPAREGMLGLPADAFAVLDAVFASGRPPRPLDPPRRRGVADLPPLPGSTRTRPRPIGVAFHLRARSDTPILRAASSGSGPAAAAARRRSSPAPAPGRAGVLHPVKRREPSSGRDVPRPLHPMKFCRPFASDR